MEIYKKLFEVKKAGITLQRDTKAFNYKYATLDQIQSKLNPEFEKQNLLVIHFIRDNKVVTQIRDIDSEEFVESEINMSSDIKAQDKGSEITYFRRYNLLSLLDLEVEDDDGKKAQESKKEVKENKVEPTEWMNDENYDNFVDNIQDRFTDGKEAVKFCRTKYKVSREMASKIESLYSGNTHKQEEENLPF